MMPQKEILLSTIREAYGRVVYTHKTHEKAGDSVARAARLVKWIELLLIALTAGTMLSVLLGGGFALQLIASVLAALSLLVTIYQFRFNPDQVVVSHRTCARKLWIVREQYVALISDLHIDAIDMLEARRRRDELSNQLYAIYESAPDTDAKAYGAAREALKINEELTFSDEEIDQLLPDSLRKAKP